VEVRFQLINVVNKSFRYYNSRLHRIRDWNVIWHDSIHGLVYVTWGLDKTKTKL